MLYVAGLDEISKAAQLLRKKFRSTEIGENEDPKYIYIFKTDAWFQEPGFGAFQALVHKLKKAY